MIATGKISAALSWLHGSHLEASKNPKAEAAPPTCEIRVLRIFQCLSCLFIAERSEFLIWIFSRANDTQYDTLL